MTVRKEAAGRKARVALGPGGEFDRIRAFLAGAPGPGPGVRVGPGDDALVLADGTVVSTDLSVEDVHFRRRWLDFREVGYRAAAAGLSDLAAMGAEPVGALVGLALSPAEAAEVGSEIVAGVREALDGVGGALLGGDLSTSPGPLFIDVVSLGRADRPILRDGARPGDELWVTGRLGGAAEAVRLWEEGSGPEPGLREAFARPKPRIREALWLAREAEVRALIDLSDGLAGDAGHLAAAGGVRAVIEADRVPVHPALSRAAAGEGAGDRAAAHEGEELERALRGGEDFELLLAASAGSVDPLVDEFSVRFGLALTRVGRVEEGEGVHLLRPGADGPVPLEGGGFSHFGDGPARPRGESR